MGLHQDAQSAKRPARTKIEPTSKMIMITSRTNSEPSWSGWLLPPEPLLGPTGLSIVIEKIRISSKDIAFSEKQTMFSLEILVIL